MQANSIISLPVAKWTQNKATLVLALQKGCHFCTDSAGFYQRLLHERSGNIRVIAVLPQEVADSTHYLQSLGVHVDKILQAPLTAIEARGTPTLLLVNKKGVLRKSWIGRLSSDKETEVIAAVRGK